MPSRPRRVIDTADIDVSTPRTLTQESSHQRNRLRRDRPTIKIRSQALKDNPALRQHNERHEKSVGELLVEKFLIKDKKLDEAEKRLQLFHQVSLETEEDEEGQDLQQIKNKIIRRFTRRRSSADIQLDPEQIEREVTYAQVQAKVLDTLVAEEQAEIENEVRRGTLIKKGAPGGPRTVHIFCRSVDGEPGSQDEEEATSQKVRKTLKKVKKKKKTTEKPSPPEGGENLRERTPSTSSDASADVQTSENDEEKVRKRSRPQMFKVEASNSVGDFSTIWVNSSPVEQFRESVKIPVPKKLLTRKTDRREDEEESETEIVLPVKKPYIKDTSRNSVYFTVKTPPETLRNDPLKKLETITNGLKPEKTPESLADKKINQILPVDVTEEVKKTPKYSKEKILHQMSSENVKEENKDTNQKTSSKDKILPKEKKEVIQKKAIEIPKQKKLEFLDKKVPEFPVSSVVSVAKKEELLESKIYDDPMTARVDENNVTLSVEPLASESSASEALPSAADRLPKASKINTDENNAVEAPKCTLRERQYLAKPTKAERDEDVVSSGKKVNKAVTLKNASKVGVSTEESNVDHLEQSLKEDNLLTKTSSPLDDANNNLVIKTTLSEGLKGDTQKSEGSRKVAEKIGKHIVEDDKDNKVNGSSVEKMVKKGVEEVSRLPFKVPTKKTESNRIENKAEAKANLQGATKTETQTNKEPKIPWRTKLSKVDTPGESSVALDRSISVDSTPVSTKEQIDPNALKQSISVDENLMIKMPLQKPTVIGEIGSLSKSTSTESIDFWSEIKGPESPKVTKVTNKGFNFAGSKSSEPGQAVEDLGSGQLDKKKETDPKISVATPPTEFSNIAVIEEERKTEEESSKFKTEQTISSTGTLSTTSEKSDFDKGDSAPKKGLKKKKNLSITIDQDAYSTVKKAPFKREDSRSSTISFKSMTNTPDTTVPGSEVSTPTAEIPVPVINIEETPTPTRSGSQVLYEEDEPKTPTNEYQEIEILTMSKWNNHSDLSNVNEEKDIISVPSKEAKATCSPEDTPESSKKKKVVRKKKSSTIKKSSTKKESSKDNKGSKKSSTKKSSAKSQEALKTSEVKNTAKPNPKNNTPTQKPIDLIRMFYTTPSALLTATPRDLSKVRRAKIKRKKHHSRTPSVSSDSTGSTTSTATTESSGSTCTDDDPEHKRMNSTRSNDSGFDGSPRISSTYSIVFLDRLFC